MQFHLKKTGFRLRAMTYNIHSCVGTDRKVNPGRVAGVIGDAEPDIVALQEVDNNIPRTRYEDQSRLLAEMLDMDAVYFPVVQSDSQQYGLAVLSRFDIRQRYYDRLPELSPRLNLQRRGCLRTEFQTPAGALLLLNTHLSLYRLERRKQVRALMRGDWLDAPEAGSAIIFCGDLNAGPLSPVYRWLSRPLVDVRKASINPVKFSPTFPSRGPLFRIDHMFVSDRLRVLDVQVPKTASAKLASDHLPLIADLEFVLN